MDSTQVRKTVERHFNAERVKETAIHIARTPCPQTELYEREPLVLKAIRNLYRPAYEEAGCDTYIDDYGNLIATQGEDTGGTHIMFMNYAMAWMEGTMPDPWSGEVMDGTPFGVEGDIVWGRGGSEYHPGNAAQLECARIIKQSGIKLPGKITYVVSSGGHTSSMDPAYHIIHNDEITADMCMIPGSPFVVLGNHGRLDLRVNIRGKSVHSGGQLEVGTNAIEGGLKVIERLSKIMPYPPKGKKDPDMGQGRLSIIGMGSYPFAAGFHHGFGSGGHTLQNLMRLLLDRRLVPGEKAEDAIAEIKEAIGDLPWQVTFERSALQHPTKHAREDRIVTTLASAYETALGQQPEYGYVGYTIDAGYFNKVGIPCIMYGGLDMRFAHGDGDFTQLNVAYDLARVMTQWAIENAR